MEGKLLECHNELAKTSSKYFEYAKEQVVFLHPGMELSQLDLLS